MRFQYVRAASLVAAAILAASCATPGGARRAVAHASAPAIPTSLSRLEIARNYQFESAQPVSVAAGADPSFALAHEGRGLQTGSDKARNFERSPRNSMALLAADELPEGWFFDGDNAARHAKSGLACPVSIELPDENRRFLLRDLEAFDDKSLDVGCNYSTDTGAFLTLYASYWPDMSLEESLAGAVAAINLRFKVEGELSVSVVTLQSEDANSLFAGLEAPQAAAFDIGKVGDARYKTALWLVKTYGWHVKARATYPLDDQTSEVVSAIMFALSHVNVRAKNMADPVAASGEV